ncbi:hypothetical protein L1987_20326 [Smallanthus sonchifolius]|uniref:Uncharacterized protein n=1 Tax=Smallanthus sonchifolius TaxID=185202 RepID=A0ACB9IRQ6_9ASTR|nr:hypothetical protein L1987_20326 [Smallanthus sonchifolius]
MKKKMLEGQQEPRGEPPCQDETPPITASLRQCFKKLRMLGSDLMQRHCFLTLRYKILSVLCCSLHSGIVVHLET